MFCSVKRGEEQLKKNEEQLKKTKRMLNFYFIWYIYKNMYEFVNWQALVPDVGDNKNFNT